MNRKKLIVTAIVLLLILLIGGLLAYFTDVDTKVNNLTLGQVDVQVVEANFPENGVADIMPGQEITKDPVVHNNGVSPVFIFAEVKVPTAKVAIADGAVSTDPVEIFDYTFNTTGGWTVMNGGDPVTTTAPDTTGIGYNTYRLAYAGEKMTSVAGNGNTASIFTNDTIRLKNIRENNEVLVAGYTSVQTKAVNIDVKAYGIQTTGIGTDTTPATVWGLIENN